VVVSINGRINREGLVALLSTQADIRVLGSTGTCAETMTLCATLLPHVLVLGVLTAWPRDLSPVSAIRLASPRTRVLALAPHGRDRCAYLNPDAPTPFDGGRPYWITHSTCLPRALSRGAHGALDGDSDPATLFDAVRTMARGERWGGADSEPPNENRHALSPRELKVSRLIGQGASNKEIATSLTISDLTVKKHVGSILQKLGLHDRLQLGVCVARNPVAFDGDEPFGWGSS
jgi:DNA-binding NarL/FixJ family response regulator